MKTHSNLALVEGEVCIYENCKGNFPKEGIYSVDWRPEFLKLESYRPDYSKVSLSYVWDGMIQTITTHPSNVRKIIYSTAKLEGIPQLERKWFVKPVDVEELALKTILPKVYAEWELDLFKAGHNDNKAEFTRDEMIQAISIARIIVRGGGSKFTTDEIISKLRPLSLPKSIMLNDDNEIISIEW